MSRFNKLRFGNLEEVRQITDGEDRLSGSEHRAVTLNLLDNIARLEEWMEKLETKLQDHIGVKENE